MNVRFSSIRFSRSIILTIVGLLLMYLSLMALGGQLPFTLAAPLATNVSSDIVADTTWTPANSPYVVTTQTVSVRNDATLTVEPGVEVRFEAGSQLQVRDGGQLYAIGTATQPITFTSNITQVRGAWSGIRFENTALTGTIQHAIIEYTQVGVEINRTDIGYNVSTNTLRYIGDFDGDPLDSGAVVGVPDFSTINANEVYSSEIGIRLNKANGNELRDNRIYDIDSHCMAFLGSASGNGNMVSGNQLSDCGANGIRIAGAITGTNNQLVGNTISTANNEGVYVSRQSNFVVRGNTVYSTAFTTLRETGQTGTDLAGIAVIATHGVDLRDNYLHDNGSAGSATYAGALYVDVVNTGIGTPFVTLTGTRVRDGYASGFVFDGAVDTAAQTIHSNAVCVDTRYEIEDQDGTMTAAGNWLGTNTPMLGTEFVGPVDITPTIQLNASAAPASAPADGSTPAIVIVTMNDGAGHTMPVGAREIMLSTNLGTFGANPITLNAAGVATTTLTSAVTGTATITATEWCDVGVPVTTTVSFEAVDVGITKTSPITEVARGGTLTYTLSVANNSGVPAPDVRITDTLPAGTSWAGDTAASAGFTRVQTGAQVVWSRSSMPASSSDAFTLSVDVPFEIACREFLTNTATVDTAAVDNNAANDSDTYSSVTLRCADMYLPIIFKNFTNTVPTPTPTPTATPTNTPTPSPTPSPTPTPTPAAWVSDVAVDEGTNQVFVGSPREDAVHVVDGATDTYAQRVPVGDGPTGLAILTSTTPSKVFVSHGLAGPDWKPGLWFIDTSTLISHPMADNNGYVGAAPVKVAVNSGTDRAYVSNYFDKLAIVDAPAEQVLTWVQEKHYQAAHGVAVSRRSNLVYLAAIDTGELIIFDAAAAEASPGTYGPCHNAPPASPSNSNEADPRIMRMVAFNEETGHLFVTSPPDPNEGQTVSKVFVLDEDALLQAAGGRPSAQTCDWNFLPLNTQALPGKGWVRTVDLTGAKSAGEEGIAVNALTDKVYVTDGPTDQVFVIQDSMTDTNISLVGTVPVGDNPQGVGANATTNKVYVANARQITSPGGTLSVLDGAGDTVSTTIDLTP